MFLRIITEFSETKSIIVFYDNNKIYDTTDFIKKSTFSVHSMTTIYLFLSAKVAKSTFLVKSPVVTTINIREKLLIKVDWKVWIEQLRMILILKSNLKIRLIKENNLIFIYIHIIKLSNQRWKPWTVFFGWFNAHSLQLFTLFSSYLVLFII